MTTNAVVAADFTNLPTSNDRMGLTKLDLEAMTEKRRLLKEFVNIQLKKGNDSDGDYAIIAGTKKPSLLKPGAEKLCQLFGLGTRISMTFKEIDHNGNFAMFVYKAEAFHLKTGVVIAECEGSANSKEKKWATRTEYVKKGNVTEKKQVETPIYDVLNTLMKMAQKRAEVGAVVKATGASDFFTHDMDDDGDAEQLGVKATVKDETPQNNALAPKKITITGNTHPIKDDIKKFGARWDMNSKAWTVENPPKELIELLESCEGVDYK